MRAKDQKDAFLPKAIQVRDNILLLFDPKFKPVYFKDIGRALGQRSRPGSKWNALQMEVEPEEEHSKALSKKKGMGGTLYFLKMATLYIYSFLFALLLELHYQKIGSVMG